MVFTTLKKLKFKINTKNKKIIFLLFINLIPIFLIFMTSLILGVKIRTMWMTPFYLFFGTLFLLIFKNLVDLKKIKKFYYTFLIFYFITFSLLSSFFSR